MGQVALSIISYSGNIFRNSMAFVNDCPLAVLSPFTLDPIYIIYSAISHVIKSHALFTRRQISAGCACSAIRLALSVSPLLRSHAQSALPHRTHNCEFISPRVPHPHSPHELRSHRHKNDVPFHTEPCQWMLSCDVMECGDDSSILRGYTTTKYYRNGPKWKWETPLCLLRQAKHLT